MALTAFANVLDSNTTISFDISDDDESDCDRSYASVCSLLVIRKRAKDSTNLSATQEPPRRIAGARRVLNYRDKMGLSSAAASATSVQLLQSITAIPALADRSFEASSRASTSLFFFFFFFFMLWKLRYVDGLFV